MKGSAIAPPLSPLAAVLASLLACLPLTWLMTPAAAESLSESNVIPAAGPSTGDGVVMLGLARDLYGLGLAQGDPLTVVAAAKLAASVILIEAKATALDPSTIGFQEATAGDPRIVAVPPEPPVAPPALTTASRRTAAKASFFTAPADDEAAFAAPVTAQDMFAMAAELAATDEVMQSLIETAMAEGPPSQTAGALQWAARLSDGQADVWEIPFHALAPAEIVVLGDGGSNLDIMVTDDAGNVLCQDVSWSDRLSCRFIPARDGYFYVTVQNLGGPGNNYHLLTN